MNIQSCILLLCKISVKTMCTLQPNYTLATTNVFNLSRISILASLLEVMIDHRKFAEERSLGKS